MNATECSLRARNLLTERSESAAVLSLPRIEAMVPTALNSWLQACMADARKRQAFMKERTVRIRNGTADMTDDLPDFQIEDIRGTTFYDASGTAATWLGSRSQLANPRPVGSDSVGLYLDGTVLRSVSAGSLTEAMTLTGTLPFYPDTVQDIPSGAEQDFVVYLALMASRELQAGESIAAAQNNK